MEVYGRGEERALSKCELACRLGEKQPRLSHLVPPEWNRGNHGLVEDNHSHYFTISASPKWAPLHIPRESTVVDPHHELRGRGTGGGGLFLFCLFFLVEFFFTQNKKVGGAPLGPPLYSTTGILMSGSSYLS